MSSEMLLNILKEKRNNVDDILWKLYCGSTTEEGRVLLKKFMKLNNDLFQCVSEGKESEAVKIIEEMEKLNLEFHNVTN